MTIKPAREIIFLIVLAILLFLFGVIPHSLAVTSTIFVDDNNSNGSEFGTITNPFNTIQEAIDAVVAGGTINIADGSYLDIFLTENNSNITIVGDSNVEINTGLFAAGLPTNRLKDVTIKGFQFTGGYSDIFLANAEGVAITNSKVEDVFQGLTLIDVKNTSIKNNIFSQNWVNLVLSGDISNTEIKFNDFISADQGIQLDASELNTPNTIKLPYNWWGSPDQPPSIDKVDRNKWLAASKDSGKPGSGYTYSGDNGRIKISGGNGSTATIYVGKYYSTLEDGVDSLSGNLTAVGSYYDIVGGEGVIAWPITITFNYNESELPTGLGESELKGLYYFKNGSWKLYGSNPANDTQGCRSSTTVHILTNTVTATVCHLTSVVVAGEHSTPTPTLTLTVTPTSSPAFSVSATTSIVSSSSQAGSDESTDPIQTKIQAASIAEIISPILDFLEVEPKTILEEFVSEGEVLGEEVVEKEVSKYQNTKTFPVKKLVIGAILISIFSYLLKRGKIT